MHVQNSPSPDVLDERVAHLSPVKRALFEQMRGEAPRAIDGPWPRRTAQEAAPLSFPQERLWFLDQLEPGNPFYNVAIAARIEGMLDPVALEQALRAVIDRHDALRTTFHAVDGRPVQVVARGAAFRLTRDDLRSLDPLDREARVARLTTEEAIRPFDLEQGPLIRARLVRTDENKNLLLLTLHHVVCDGWSMAVLENEVAEHYAARLERREPRCGAMPLQYADFAVWQREQMGGAAMEAHWRYWSRELADLPTVLELPTDHPRPAVQTFRGNTRRRRIDGRLAAALRALAADEHATLFMVLMGAFQVLLARLAHQRDLCLGTPIAGRGRPELEGLIGFFANTLVIRGRLDENPSFRAFLAALRKTILGAFAHQDLPFEELVERLRPARDLARNPVVQALFVLQNIPLKARQVPGLSIAGTTFDHAPVANFDLTLNVEQRDDQLELSLVYNRDLFDAATIDRWLGSYQAVLAAIVADRDAKVLELPILSTDERRKLLVTWNETQADFPENAPIHELFTQQAGRSPDAAALWFAGKSVTYAQLDRRSNRLARHLIDRGAGPDVLVGLCLERSIELITALLAILKSGAAYVPLDPNYPHARRAYMIEDAGLSLVVARGNLRGLLPGDRALVMLDEDEHAIAACDARSLPRISGPGNLAYVIYTSGSTGEPKGVEVEHRGLVNHSLALAQLFGLCRDDRMLQFLSPSFDAAAEEIFPTLLCGAALYLHSDPAELSGRVLLDWSRAHGVNVLHLPGPVWSSLVDELAVSGGHVAQHLKAVLAGGESLPADRLRKWRNATGDAVKFLYAYGVTEATITTTIFDGAAVLPPTSSSCVPIGRPIANNRVYVLDEFRNPVPVGVAGELYIGGVGVARGYRGQAELSAERFVPDVFHGRDGARMYRTGDLVRHLPDGNLEFLGRVDRQVKVSGYRIEPGEIEAALQLHERVREAIVVADGPGEAKRLVAYVGCGSEAQPAEAQLREFLAARLPAHMLPAAVVVMDRLPRLACAKVDVAALPRPCWERGAARDFVAPSNDIERGLAEVWAAILGVERVGVYDNFFDLGGDSIRSIQVVARARAAGMCITPKQLFEHQTIAALATVAGTRRAPRAPQGPLSGPMALLPIQHEFFALVSDDRHHFNQSMLLNVARPTSAETLRAAIDKLATHHDALRARYRRRSDGAWLQTIMPPDSMPLLEPIDLAQTAPGEVAEAIERVAARTQASLNLADGPLARFVYFDLGPDRPGRLLIVIHHLAVDAVSWRILLEDLHAACGQLARGPAIELAPKTSPPGEWAQRLAVLADSPQVRGELDFWASMGGGAAPLVRDLDGGANLAGSVRTVRVGLDRAATQSLLGDAQATHRARPHEMLLTALVAVVSDYAKLEAVHLDLEGHGREDLFEDVDLTRTVGWFTSLYPLLLRRPPGCSPTELLRAIKEQLRAVRNGGIGYGLLRWLTSERAVRERLAALPRPEICFNFLGQLDHALPADATFTWAGESCGPDYGPRAARRHLWEIIAYVRDASLFVEWRYDADSHRPRTIEQLAAAYTVALRSLVGYRGASAAVTAWDFPLSEVDEEDMAVLSRLLDHGR
ncbi:MAG: amino acid adenylation domain-containing protein [Planctomycetia bacterium]|nr:amino acid adenylation domain-containing protein [Planctomycetia bacterium]